MITIILIVAIALLTGLGLKLYFDYIGSEYSISWVELGAGAIVCAFVIAWPVVKIGTSMAQASAATYKEYWSGYELETTSHTDKCRKYSDESLLTDNCVHHYRCDSYTVVKTRTVTYYDSDNKAHTRTETYTETHWHYCPESKIELSYYVDTTLGQYAIARHVLPPNPYQYEWDRDGKIPASLLATAHVPAFWTAAGERIKAGRPGPVSAIKPYKNYILASQKTILKKFSGSVDGYRKDGLMPDVAKKLDFPYLGKKAYLVGSPAGVNEATWTDAVNRFNAVFGTDLQGDLHLLIVNAKRVKNPDEWFGALNANWQSKRQGKNAIAKNALVVAIGTEDGKTISWARASTGMPLGNEALLVQIQSDLKNQSLDPLVVIGDPVILKPKPYLVIYGGGILGKAVRGENRFVRVSMSCSGPEDHCIGYGYLSGEIQPSTGAKVAIFGIALILCLAVWGAMLAIGPIPIGRRST